MFAVVFCRATVEKLLLYVGLLEKEKIRNSRCLFLRRGKQKVRVFSASSTFVDVAVLRLKPDDKPYLCSHSSVYLKPLASEGSC